LAIPHWLAILLTCVLGAGPLVTVVVWTLVLVGVERSARSVPTLRFGLELADGRPPVGRVCVVVPAFNEVDAIAGLIHSLRAETYPDLRVVLALDRCTDGTAEAARRAFGNDARFEIVEIENCPDDWAGKVNAVHAGVVRSGAAAQAEFLLFADADTLFSPGCIASALALMHHRRLDLLSLLSTLRHEHWFELVVQTAAVFELMTQYPLMLVNAGKERRAFANGQFMLFRRDAYDAIGGHAAVKSALLEDLALARLVEAKRMSAGVFLSAGLFHCRMYSDWRQFRRGWKRIYIESANRKARRLELAARRIRWLGTILPAWMLGAGVVSATLVASGGTFDPAFWILWSCAVVVWIGTLARISWLSQAPLWTAPLHIVGAWLTANVLGEAAADLQTGKPTSWGGRQYDLRIEKPQRV
jgi:cellulose synthase/poly-beta-1,6-N-acetylglucosamine synthase-like glycosyltransferase